MPSKDYDWKINKRGWPYKEDAPYDDKYIKERNELFEKNGNGWWWYQGVSATVTPKKYRKTKGGTS